MEKLKSPSLILLIISLCYVGIMGVTIANTLLILGLCGLNALEIGLVGLNIYVNSKIKPEKELSELDLIIEDIKKEEANLRLEKIRKRETVPMGFSQTGKKLEF